MLYSCSLVIDQSGMCLIVYYGGELTYCNFNLRVTNTVQECQKKTAIQNL